MPRGDFLGARNMGLPARSRETPTAAAGVLDRGRRLHPHNTHLSLTHKPERSEQDYAQSARSTPIAKSKRLSLFSTASSEDLQEMPSRCDDFVDSEPSWEPVHSVVTRASRSNYSTRHVDTGTPLGYSPAHEAYHFDVKDRWCTSSCLCLHHAAASDDPRLCRAALQGHLPFTRKHGMGEPDEAGRTPVMVAAWRGSVRALAVLLHGSNLDLADKDNRTVFHWAALAKDPVDVFQLLCGRNCESKSKDKFGDTCLHKMVARGNARACEILCRNDPRLVLVKNKSGKTAFDVAKSERIKEIVSVDEANAIIREWVEETEQEAAKLYEEQQKEAHRLRMEELEAMTHKKRTEMAQNLGTAKVKKYNSGTERDDWDVFNKEQQSKRQHFSRQNVQTMHDNEVTGHGIRDWDESELEEVQEVTYFTSL